MGFYDDLTTRPLTYNIEKMVKLASVRKASVDEIRNDITNGDLDVALLPAWDFMRVGHLNLVPSCCISTFGPANVFLLCSKVLPTEIRRVLVDHESFGARSLAHILLPAQMGVRPDFIRSDVSLNPREFDFDADPHEAFLLVGENALLANHSKFTWIYDLSKGWHGLTSSPFVIHVWGARRGVDLRGVEKEIADALRVNIQSPNEYIQKERDRLHVGAGLEVIFKRILRTECGPAEISALRHYARELMRAQVIKGAPQFMVYRPPVAAGTRARAYR